MPSFVALLRGITPSNPKHRNAHLRAVCEGLGLDDVATVISSGNIVFTTDRTDRAALEAELEAAWIEQLDFHSTTILRSRDDLVAVVEHRPFGDLDHGPTSYLLVTFAKHPLEIPFDRPEGHAFELIGATPGELFTVSDTTAQKTPDVMSWIERRFGRDLTSRTWLTVHRILQKMG